MYERLIKERMENELRRTELLNDRYDFCKGCSTLQALLQVIDTKETTRRKWCELIAFNVKNAFNSACWKVLMKKLRMRKFPQYIVDVIAETEGVLVGRAEQELKRAPHSFPRMGIGALVAFPILT